MYTGQEIQLRSFEWEDAQQYRVWANSADVRPLIDRVLPITQLEHKQWYESIIQDPRSVIFSIEMLESSAFIGCVWLHAIHERHRHAEIRIVIGETKHQGKGLGFDALNTILDYAFKHHHLHKVYAYILADNIASQKCFKKAGFVQEGLFKQECYINGQYLDLIRLAKFR